MWHTLDQTRYFRENGKFPSSIESNAYIRKMFGPVSIPKPTVVNRYVHPSESRLLSLIKSRRDSMHFLLDQLRYDFELAGDERAVERLRWYVHCHAVYICVLCQHIRTVRLHVAMGTPVPDFDTVR